MAGIADMKQIKLEQYKSSQDAKGNNTESVVRTVRAWAEVNRKGGARALYAGQNSLTNVMTFTVKFKPDVYPTGNWRVIYLGRVHVITNIERVEEKRFEWDFIAVSQGKK